MNHKKTRLAIIQETITNKEWYKKHDEEFLPVDEVRKAFTIMEKNHFYKEEELPLLPIHKSHWLYFKNKVLGLLEEDEKLNLSVRTTDQASSSSPKKTVYMQT